MTGRSPRQPVPGAALGAVARPPSSAADAAPGQGLFDGVLARGAVAAAVDDRAWLQALLDVEAGLARALAAAGVVEGTHAAAVVSACDADRFDVAALGAAAAATGTPVVPLVRALRAAVGPPADAVVHRGATSQDVVDSAAMLVATRALVPILGDLRAASDAAAEFAARYRDTPMAARTLLQHALPTTFGLVAAGWMTGLDEVARRLDEVRRERLAVQFGGAAGTLAALGDAGPAVLRTLAAELGLAEPVLPWHTIRTRPAELAGALGAAAGVIAKVALDLTLLAATEVAEVTERAPGRGGSSTLPHKRNPVAAVAAVACAAQAPGLTATMLAAMAQEHQRAAGAWHAEWRPWSELLRSVGSAAAWLRDGLAHADVDPVQMRATLGLTRGALLGERVANALAERVGVDAAHDLVARAAGGAGLADDPELRRHLGDRTLARLLEPTAYLGSAGVFVDRALAAHERERP